MASIHPPTEAAPKPSRPPSSASPALSAPPRAVAARRARILVVDDEPVMGSVLRRIFSRAHDVTVVDHAKAALAIFDSGADFDVVLCDVVMPELSGPELYEAVSRRHPCLLERFIFITGGALQEKSQGLPRVDHQPHPPQTLRAGRRARAGAPPPLSRLLTTLAPPAELRYQGRVLTFDPEALDTLVHRATGHRPTAVEPMPGGASTRRYLRVRTPASSLVAMFVPDAAPEEITSSASTAPARWPFLEVHALLDGRGVRVPRLHGEACEHGLLLIEDLGDETLAAFLDRAPARRAEIYRAAVTDLAAAQRSLGDLPPASVIASRAFDEVLLRWELDHFREWGLDARGRSLDAGARARFDALADRLARRIAAWPRGFVHRDYQSRNLMVRERPDGSLELVWIDFQDALLGPRVYDLVALLNDSYQSFDRPFIEARLDEFASAAGLDAAGRAELGREFDVVTVQRKLKDAGRFIFIDRVKKNPAFLPYFEPSLAKVRAALARLEGEEDMRELAEIVARA